MTDRTKYMLIGAGAWAIGWEVFTYIALRLLDRLLGEDPRP